MPQHVLTGAEALPHPLGSSHTLTDGGAGQRDRLLRGTSAFPARKGMPLSLASHPRYQRTLNASLLCPIVGVVVLITSKKRPAPRIVSRESQVLVVEQFALC